MKKAGPGPPGAAASRRDIKVKINGDSDGGRLVYIKFLTRLWNFNFP